MPFVLRRTKQQVLKDLPPKIITDIYCDLTPLQRSLYEDFASTPAAASAASALRTAAATGGDDGSSGGGGAVTHVFQALAYLRKLCSHPLLVLDWNVDEHREAASAQLGARSLADAQSALSRAEAAPKLLALRDLLVQCGLVADPTGSDNAGAGGSSSGGSGGIGGAAAAAVVDDGGLGLDDGGHRLLVFAQLKATLDHVEGLLTPLGVRFIGGLRVGAGVGGEGMRLWMGMERGERGRCTKMISSAAPQRDNPKSQLTTHHDNTPMTGHLPPPGWQRGCIRALLGGAALQLRPDHPGAAAHDACGGAGAQPDERRHGRVHGA